MGKAVRAFTVTWQEQHGPWSMPTSEQSYRDHKRLVDAVLPTHGGILQPGTGEWVRHGSTESDFAAYLLNTAREMRQDYLPACVPYGMGDEAAFLAFLEAPDDWQEAADNLVVMALTDFDAPWDGVLYDYPGGGGAWTDEQVRAQEDFVTVVSDAVRAAGLPFAVAFRGIVPGDESWSPSLDVFRDITDQFDYYMYVYWGQPYSPSPYWWCKESVENVLSHGFEADRIFLGLFIASWYYDLGGSPFNYWITYDQAMQVVQDNGATVEWVEDHAAGLIREKYAAIGDSGHLWIHDRDTVNPRLALVDEYGLGGVMLFVLGCESGTVWEAIDGWKNPAPVPLMRPKVGNVNPGLYGSGGLFSVGDLHGRI